MHHTLHEIDTELERIRGILSKRYMISGSVTPRILVLSQYLDALIVQKQTLLLDDAGEDRLLA